MKKIFLLATLLGVALTSCVKDELSQEAKQQSKIVFDTPVVSPSTKVAEIPVGYDNNLSFGVWAKYYQNGNYVDNGFASAPLYMNNVKVKKDATEGWITYGGSPEVVTPYYWPKNGTLTFIAYSPYEANATFDHTGITFTDYTVDGDVSKQKDLLYSERTYNYNTGIVPIAFKHALSSIRFTVKAGGTYTGTTLTLKSVSLTNVYPTATFNQGLTDISTSETPTLNVNASGVLTVDETFLWTGHTGTPTEYFATIHDDAKVLSTTAEYLHNGKSYVGTNLETNAENTTSFILIPQNLTNIKLKVVYEIENPGGVVIEQTGIIDLYQTDGVQNPNGTALNRNDMIAWERGKRYTYNITVGLNKITFTPSVEGWDDIVVDGAL